MKTKAQHRQEALSEIQSDHSAGEPAQLLAEIRQLQERVAKLEAKPAKAGK